MLEDEQKRHQAAGDMTPSAFCKVGTDRRRLSHPEKHITPATESRP